MTRIPGVAPEGTEKRIAAVLDAQQKAWGTPLANHLVYARRPSIFAAVRGMWSGLEASGLLPATLVALLNRRVARRIGCPF